MDLVVVLGKRLNDDGSMKKELVERMELGIKTFYETKADYLAVCGGMPNKKAAMSEASQMYMYLMEKSFPEDSIMVEEKSLTTFGNAYYLKKELKKEKVDKIYLVSSKYHFQRKWGNCLSIFKKRFKNTEIISFEAEE